MINSKKIKNQYILIAFVMLIFFSTGKTQAQSSGQLYLIGPTTVHYGDVVAYSLRDGSDNEAPSSSKYWNFNWTIQNNGTVLTYINESYQPDAEVYWDGTPSQEKVYVLYQDRSESYQYVAELNVTVLASPSTPANPIVLSTGCNQVVLQRSDPPGNIRTGGQDITWYWQSTPTGTSTANSSPTITLTSGTEYYLRARRSNGIWSDGASSVQYLIGIPAPIVVNVNQPTITTPTGSVSLAGLPDTGTWVINPGNISGTGENKTITGLSPATTYNFTVTNSSGCTSPASTPVVINAQSLSLDAPVLSAVTQPDCITSKGEFTITNYSPSYNYTATPSAGVSFLGEKVIAPQGNYTIKAVSGVTTSPSSAIVTINAQPVTPSAPVVGTIVHPTLSTPTGSVQLSGLPSGYFWIINPGNITGAGATTTITGLKAGIAHKFTVTNSAGCTSAASADIVINLQPFVCGGISDDNYVQTTVPLAETADVGSLLNNQKQESITYYDGIGRPKQKIAIRGGGSNTDIITHVDYDPFGRQTKEYLPYTDGNNCGAFRTADINLATKNYYKAQFPLDISNATPNPYSEKQIEASPLNRVLKQAAPGEDWRLGKGHEIKMDYQTNGTADAVKNFGVNFVLVDNVYTPTLINAGLYNDNELYKNVIYDENTAANPDELNGSTVEFKNKEGQVILKRTYGIVDKGTSNEKHDTYYVYDDFGNLSFVIPPKAVDLIGVSTGVDANPTSDVVINSGSSLHIKGTSSITLKEGFHAIAGSTFSAVIVDGNQTVLDNLCYQYKYDQRKRLIEKKLPGKQWEYIVYDKLDRPILTQDANLRTANKWLFTKYDVFNRVVYTGEYTNTVKTTRADVQLLADATATVFETKQATSIINGSTVYYSNSAFPNINDANINLFTINYYDDYNFDLNSGISETSYNITPITNARGLATGSKVRILGKPNWITNVNYYDAKGRSIYNYSLNDYLGTTNKIKSQFDFVGKTKEVTSTHLRNSVTTTIVDAFTYDDAGRLTKQTQAINGAATPEIIVANTFDELGQLSSKKVGGKTTQGLQTVDFKYNVRGWLKNINDVNTIGTDLFAFQINYNDIADVSKKLYNGNISQTFWKTANTDTSLKNYTYTYDNLNRLTNALDNLNKFNESLNYDKNGNITKLVRLGEIVGGVPLITNSLDFGTMDNLTYTYDAGNKLQIVSDSANDTYGFKDDLIGTADDTTTDYTYDGNGNMKTDTNKGITDITYNHLNLPTQVTIGGQNIKYEYDATGTKQQKIANSITTDYAGIFIYEGNQMKFFSQPEGYVTNNSGTFDYIYQYKDHLGNVRLSYGDTNNNGSVVSGEIIEENNYYPFGLKQKGYNNITMIGKGNATAQKYKYNGKELQDELGLAMYDYGARNYDPALGRWMNIDPLAEKSRRFSPYTYALNNPVYFIDPDGMMADDWKTDANGNMIFDPNLTKENASTQLNDGDSYVGATSTEDVSNDAGNYTLTYNSDGSISSSDNHESSSSDGIRVFGGGGDAVAGSGDLGNDRGSGSIDGTTTAGGGVVNDLFNLGSVIGNLFNSFLMSNPTTIGLGLELQYGNSNNQSATESTTPTSPVMVDMQIQNYSTTDPIRGNDSQVHVGKPRDTSVVPSDSARINSLNKQNYNIKKQEAQMKTIIYKQTH